MARAKPHSAAHAVAVGIHAIERIEEPRQCVRRHSRAVVANLNNSAARHVLHCNFHRRSNRRISNGIADNVLNGTAKQLLVSC